VRKGCFSYIEKRKKNKQENRAPSELLDKHPKKKKVKTRRRKINLTTIKVGEEKNLRSE